MIALMMAFCVMKVSASSSDTFYDAGIMNVVVADANGYNILGNCFKVYVKADSKGYFDDVYLGFGSSGSPTIKVNIQGSVSSQGSPNIDVFETYLKVFIIHLMQQQVPGKRIIVKYLDWAGFQERNKFYDAMQRVKWKTHNNMALPESKD